MTRHPAPVLASGRQLEKIQAWNIPDQILFMVGVLQTCGLMNGVPLELLRIRLGVEQVDRDMRLFKGQIRRHRFVTDAYGHPLWVVFPTDLQDNMDPHLYLLGGSIILTDFGWNLLRAKGSKWMRLWMDKRYYRSLIKHQKTSSAYNNILRPTYCPTSTVELLTRMCTYFIKPQRFHSALWSLAETAERRTHTQLWTTVLCTEEGVTEVNDNIQALLNNLNQNRSHRDRLSTALFYTTSGDGHNMDRSFILDIGCFAPIDRRFLPPEEADRVDAYMEEQTERNAVKAGYDEQNADLNHPKKRDYLRRPITVLTEFTDMLHDQCGFDEVRFLANSLDTQFPETTAHTLKHAVITASWVFVGDANRNRILRERRDELAGAQGLDINNILEQVINIDVVHQPCTNTIEQILSGNITGQPNGPFLVLLRIQVNGTDKWILWAPFISPANYIGGVLFPVKSANIPSMYPFHVRHLQNDPNEAQDLLTYCLKPSRHDPVNVNFVEAFFLRKKPPDNPLYVGTPPLPPIQGVAAIFEALHTHCNHLLTTADSVETTAEILTLSRCHNASSIVVLGYQVLHQATALDSLPIRKRTMSVEEALDTVEALQVNPMRSRKIKKLGIQAIVRRVYLPNDIEPVDGAQAPHPRLLLIAMSFIVDPITHPVTKSRYTQWFLWAPRNNGAAGGVLFPDKHGRAVVIEHPPSCPRRVKLLLAEYLFPGDTDNLEGTRPKLVWVYSLGRAPNGAGND